MTTTTATLGERGLVRLPSAIREEAELERGQELIMTVEGPGHVRLTTPQAVQAEVWAAAPTQDGPDAVETIRGYRAADRARADEKYAGTKQPASDDEPNPAGDALLHALGL